MARPRGDSETGGIAARIKSAAILAPLVLAAVYLGTPVFEIGVGIAGLILAWEWNRLCSGSIPWLIGGLFYIAGPCLALFYLRSDPVMGMETLFWLLAIVWSTDTGAYVVGLTIGGPKMSPVISPKKTWSGLLGGIGFAGLAGYLTALILQKSNVLPLVGWSAVIGAFSQAGDLAESWVKRHFGVKDTGTILPGHGGLFDRVDGLLAAALAVVAVGVVNKGSILTWT